MWEEGAQRATKGAEKKKALHRIYTVNHFFSWWEHQTKTLISVFQRERLTITLLYSILPKHVSAVRERHSTEMERVIPVPLVKFKYLAS